VTDKSAQRVAGQWRNNVKRQMSQQESEERHYYVRDYQVQYYQIFV
jgi:hypothetical protein